MNLGEKIDFLLKKTSMTKVELARRLGLRDSSVVSHWVKNRFRPEKENVEKMSHVFDKPMSYFSDDISYSQIEAERAVYDAIMHSAAAPSHIGVVGAVRKSPFYLSLNGPVDEYLPIFLESNSAAKPFAFKIEADGVCSAARNGEYALIVPATEVAEGKLALVKMNGAYLLREIVFDKKIIILKDGKKQTKAKPAEVEITGVAAGFFRK